jgi:hypothetical protein
MTKTETLIAHLKKTGESLSDVQIEKATGIKNAHVILARAIASGVLSKEIIGVPYKNAINVTSKKYVAHIKYNGNKKPVEKPIIEAQKKDLRLLAQPRMSLKDFSFTPLPLNPRNPNYTPSGIVYVTA